MTSKQKEALLQEILTVLRSNHFVEDPWGNWKRAFEKRIIRYKFRPRTLRKEAKAIGGKEWIKVWSQPYSALAVVDGKIAKRELP